jgi:hypothetical protein
MPITVYISFTERMTNIVVEDITSGNQEALPTKQQGASHSFKAIPDNQGMANIRVSGVDPSSDFIKEQRTLAADETFEFPDTSSFNDEDRKCGHEANSARDIDQPRRPSAAAESLDAARSSPPVPEEPA